jgi:hypothetical protein
MDFSADLLGSTMGELTARSPAAKLPAEQIGSGRGAAVPRVVDWVDQRGAGAAGFGASAVVATA